MGNSDLSRLSRLTSILIQLQTRRLVVASELTEKFQVSKRTIYRDIKALEQAGVPIITIDGKGYSLMKGYKVPPVMFTEAQVNALILAEQLVLKNKDASLVKDYSEAINKIKSILSYTTQDKVNILAGRTQYNEVKQLERTSNSLSVLQNAITNYILVKINYINKDGTASIRDIEPFALLSTENWYLIAWCRMREAFRFFRLDRIESLTSQPVNFEPHGMSLQEYFDNFH